MKHTCLLIGLLFFLPILKAAPVDSITAKTVAANFYLQNYKATALSLKLMYTEKSSEGEPEYYIYNVYPDAGFVIVSADDAAYPIIGYSSEGYYRPAHTPPNFSFWMQRYKLQITSIRHQHLRASADIQNEWDAYKNNVSLKNKKTASSITPLLKTAWAQAPYYNALCPITVVDGIDSNDAAGCVATAMAQIMKYWAYPPHGIGASSYTDNPYGVLTANYDTTHYHWTQMPNNISSLNIPIATLTYDCGVSVDMSYTVDNSGAFLSTTDNPYSSISAESAFIQYFGYSSSIQAVYESGYSYTSWESLLENELNNKRPIQYAGLGNQGGHSWVCDGYDATGDFHMNWGWAGYEDGYYKLNSLNPDNIPLSTHGEEALIGIEPAPAVAYFSAAPIIIWAGDTVAFTDNSLGYDTITAWQWSFPGGITSNSNSQNPAVIYTTPGTYNVSETVTTNKGSNTSTQVNYIIVLDNNTVNVYPTLNDGSFTVQLHDASLAGNDIKFSLYDMLGNKVYATTLVQYRTQLTVTVPHGMYFFRAFDASGKPVSTGKLMIK